MSKVHNFSTGEMEKAKKGNCPRCYGYGSIVFDNGGDCYICNGNGIVWISVKETGWCRPIGGIIGASEKMY